MSDRVYGIGAGLFFLGYFVFEIPSNLILERVGARRWLARIMITWGIVSMAMMFVVGKWSFYGMRDRAWPGRSRLLSRRDPLPHLLVPAARARPLRALFMIADAGRDPDRRAVVAACPHASSNGALGLRGWQWLFLGEGLPAVVAGVIALGG